MTDIRTATWTNIGYDIRKAKTVEEFKKDLQKTEAFLAEQENLPFEQSQKQVLIQKGELK